MQEEIDQTMIKHADDWLSAHHHLTREELNELASENSFIALERLRELADIYNVSYDDTTTPRQLADQIALAMEQGQGFQQNYFFLNL